MNICADCRRYMDCPWEIAGEPVPGWTARPARIQITRRRIVDTFDVISCPRFLPPYPGYTPKPGKKDQRPRAIKATHVTTGEVRYYDSVRATGKDGFNRQNVYKVLRGQWRAYKNWRFEDDRPRHR